MTHEHSAQQMAREADVEKIARLLCVQRGISPETLHQFHDWENWPEDGRSEYRDIVTNEPRAMLLTKAWRKRVADADAILAALSPKGAGE